jgi:hypothetical protein
LTAGGAGDVDAVLGVGATFSGLLPVDAQADRTAEAAAIENVRRDKRGDDGFNEFSSDGADVQAKGRAAGHAKAIAGGDPWRATRSRREQAGSARTS